MLTWFKTIADFFEVKVPEKSAMEDPTIYEILTSNRKYCGQIIYQDDIIIQLKIAKPKAVKILKTNIDRITIVQTVLAKEYYQRQQNKVGDNT